MVSVPLREEEREYSQLFSFDRLLPDGTIDAMFHTLDKKSGKIVPTYFNYSQERYELVKKDRIEHVKLGREEGEREKREGLSEYKLKSIRRALTGVFRYSTNRAIEQNECLRKIRITREAYEKAQLIARKTLEVLGNNEISLDLIGKEGSLDYIIRDIYISHDQEVTAQSCAINATQEGTDKTSKDFRGKEIEIIGWAHSHSTMPTFHSDIDKRNILYCSKNKIRFNINPLAGADELIKKIGFYPSIVFNANGDTPNCALSMSFPEYNPETDSFEQKNEIKYNVSLEIVEESNGISSTEEEISSQIRERVHPKNRRSLDRIIDREEVAKECSPHQEINLQEETYQEKKSQNPVESEEDRVWTIKGWIKKFISSYFEPKQKIIEKRFERVEAKYEGLFKKYQELQTELENYKKENDIRVSNLEMLVKPGAN
jgi:hypothetical protein